MLRTFLSAVVVFTVISLMAAAGQEAKNKAGTDDKAKRQQATITKVDAKNGTVTVRMKDKNGKDTDRVFKLTGDIRYFDSTGKAAAIDFFRSGDEVLVVEAEGQLQELRHGDTALGKGAFLKAVAEIDLAEMKLGQLAQDRASAAAIKKLGERIATDHSKMNTELLKLAKAQEVTLPEKVDRKHQDLIDQLSKMKGQDFDHAFVKDMVAGHEQAIKKFETQAKNGQDANVKAWAEKWLPTLREHLKEAQTVAKDVNSSR